MKCVLSILFVAFIVTISPNAAAAELYRIHVAPVEFKLHPEQADKPPFAKLDDRWKAIEQMYEAVLRKGLTESVVFEVLPKSEPQRPGDLHLALRLDSAGQYQAFLTVPDKDPIQVSSGYFRLKSIPEIIEKVIMNHTDPEAVIRYQTSQVEMMRNRNGFMAARLGGGNRGVGLGAQLIVLRWQHFAWAVLQWEILLSKNIGTTLGTALGYPIHLDDSGHQELRIGLVPSIDIRCDNCDETKGGNETIFFSPTPEIAYYLHKKSGLILQAGLHLHLPIVTIYSENSGSAPVPSLVAFVGIGSVMP